MDRRVSLGAAAGLGLLACGCAPGNPPGLAESSLSAPADALSASEQRRAELAVLESVSAGAPRRWDAGRLGYYGYVEPERRCGGRWRLRMP